MPLLQLTGAHRNVDGRRSRSANELEQQDHLVSPVGPVSAARLIEQLDRIGQAGTGPCAGLLGLKNAGPHELDNVIQFVGGKALEKGASLTPVGLANHAAQCAH